MIIVVHNGVYHHQNDQTSNDLVSIISYQTVTVDKVDADFW